uniref:THAP-type domain-containing protein n=1 Tax=Bombyx mori TaxID=7091 RepID=A0A8R2M105_BOMMO|nr:uncharacterized protein LOC119629486 [Bombyx mori]
MWINATGRGPSWFPTKNHTICSSHFEPKCFQPLKKVRWLFEWSVPTLKLRMVLMNYMEPSTSKVCFYSELDKKDPNLTVALKLPTGTESQNLTGEKNDNSENTAPTSTIYGIDTNFNARQNSSNASSR